MGARLRQFLMTTSFGQSEAGDLGCGRAGRSGASDTAFCGVGAVCAAMGIADDRGEQVQLGALPSLLLRYAWPQTQTAQPTSPTPASESGRILFAWSAAGGDGAGGGSGCCRRPGCKARQIPFDSQRDVISHLSPQRLVRALSGEVGQPPVAVLHILCHGAEQSGSFWSCLER